jgi:hypothetical protein
MRKLNQLSVYMLLLSAGWVGCKSDVDTTLPEITKVLVDGTEADVHTIQAGEMMEVVFNVSDNENLKQIKLNVHPADDGHSHGSGSASTDQPNVGTWTYSKIYDVEGKSVSRNLSLSVPIDIAGTWHLEFMALDESGNEAVEKVVTLTVNNDELPVIQVTSSPEISASAMFELTASNPVLTLDATAADASGIDSVYISATSEAGVEVFSQSWDAANAFEFGTGAVQITFPGVDLYDLEIRALDVNGYENIWIREVQVQ